jgi:hypothetical protein
VYYDVTKFFKNVFRRQDHYYEGSEALPEKLIRVTVMLTDSFNRIKCDGTTCPS